MHEQLRRRGQFFLSGRKNLLPCIARFEQADAWNKRSRSSRSLGIRAMASAPGLSGGRTCGILDMP